MGIMDFVYVCIRVPKSGSSSLIGALTTALADSRRFFLPDTLNLDGQFSAFQRWRFRRARAGNLLTHYGSRRMSRALAVVKAEARAGDLIYGGHFDFNFARQALGRPVKIITMLRNPVERVVSEYNYARHNHLRRNPIQRIDSKLQAKIAARYSLIGYLDWLLERREVYGDLASRILGWDGAQSLDDFFRANVFHAGVLEDTPGFARGLSEKLGRTVDFPWANATLGRSERGACAEARTRLERLYPRDFELYEHQL